MKNSFEGSIQGVGRGEVSAPPDEAIVMLNVVTQGETASEAVSANAELMDAVIKAVKEEPHSEMTTFGLGVYPVYEHDPKANISKLVGFRATNGVQVKTEPNAAGQVFDAGIEAGANVSSGISYRIQDEAPLREEALRLAVENAFFEAQLVAATAKVELLGPETIVIDPMGRPMDYRVEKLAVDAAGTPTIPENLTLMANVRITFRTKVGSGS